MVIQDRPATRDPQERRVVTDQAVPLELVVQKDQVVRPDQLEMLEMMELTVNLVVLDRLVCKLLARTLPRSINISGSTIQLLL